MVTQLKEEALRRIKMLDFHPDVERYLRDDEEIYYSERSPLGGILYWLSNNPDWEEIVNNVQEEYDILVYHIMHDYTDFGELLTMLYVSDNEDEWELDREDLSQDGEKYAMAYVYNLSTPEFSEFGSIGFREASGGLIRTA